MMHDENDNNIPFSSRSSFEPPPPEEALRADETNYSSSSSLSLSSATQNGFIGDVIDPDIYNEHLATQSSQPREQKNLTNTHDGDGVITTNREVPPSYYENKKHRDLACNKDNLDDIATPSPKSDPPPHHNNTYIPNDTTTNIIHCSTADNYTCATEASNDHVASNYDINDRHFDTKKNNDDDPSPQFALYDENDDDDTTLAGERYGNEGYDDNGDDDLDTTSTFHEDCDDEEDSYVNNVASSNGNNPWEMYTDDHGKAFYYNTETGESVWAENDVWDADEGGGGGEEECRGDDGAGHQQQGGGRDFGVLGGNLSLGYEQEVQQQEGYNDNEYQQKEQQREGYYDKSYQQEEQEREGYYDNGYQQGEQQESYHDNGNQQSHSQQGYYSNAYVSNDSEDEINDDNANDSFDRLLRTPEGQQALQREIKRLEERQERRRRRQLCKDNDDSFTSSPRDDSRIEKGGSSDDNNGIDAYYDDAYSSMSSGSYEEDEEDDEDLFRLLLAFGLRKIRSVDPLSFVRNWLWAPVLRILLRGDAEERLVLDDDEHTSDDEYLNDACD